MPIVMGGSTVQISHSNFLTNNLLTKPNTFSGNNTFSGQTTIQTGSVTGNLPVSGRVTATSFTGSLSFNNGRSPYSIYGHGTPYNHIDGINHSTNMDLTQGQYATIQSPWNTGATRVYASHTLFCGVLVG